MMKWILAMILAALAVVLLASCADSVERDENGIVRPDCDLWPWDPGCQEGGGGGTGGGGGSSGGSWSCSGVVCPAGQVCYANGGFCNWPVGSRCWIGQEPAGKRCWVNSYGYCQCYPYPPGPTSFTGNEDVEGSVIVDEQ